MLFDHAARLEKIEDIDALWAEMLSVFGTAGIDHVVYLSVANDFSDVFARATIEDLYSDRPAAEDPFLQYCCDSYDVILAGAAHIDRHPYVSDEERAFIERAARFGLNAALAIPMRLKGARRFGGFIIGNGQTQAQFRTKILPRAEELRLFCMIVHRRIEELIAPESIRQDPDVRPGLVDRKLPDAFDKLTPRETEVIMLLSQGKTRAESARLCGISIHTLSDYAKAGYRKLGVSNAAGAAALMIPPPEIRSK
ncbi:autoinducer binding domain-containing protein [Sulfitobacter sp. HNIBRBA3233]|uniref:helix-turn-helix transcriptional regulator n=1 Tax=Sulfitobacter marinivivus TaxID=3158558 RepID=UPI0032DE7055